jgi:hypothetical protein
MRSPVVELIIRAQFAEVVVSNRLILIIVLAVHLSGCSDLARWVRQYTYPPEFRYVERDEVRGTMRELARHARQVDHLMLVEDAPQEHRGEIIEHLRAMEQAAEKLDQSGWSTNHPKVEMNLPTFRRDLKFAREAIEREPPNYLLTATVTGACVLCHGSR